MSELHISIYDDAAKAFREVVLDVPKAKERLARIKKEEAKIKEFLKNEEDSGD